MAEAIESLHVECLGVYTLDEGTTMLREAIAKCAEKRVFARSMRRVRSTATMAADWLNIIPHLAYFQSAGIKGSPLAQILEHFEIEGDRTRFGLMNAVTSVARDTRDPEERWRLEELGGSIGARLRPRQPSDAPACSARLRSSRPSRSQPAWHNPAAAVDRHQLGTTPPISRSDSSV